MERRHVIVIGALLPVLLTVRRAFAAVVGAPVPDSGSRAPSPTFVAWLDTLLPGDGASPPASAIGVADTLMVQAQNQGKARPLLSAGVRWLDEAARRQGAARFAELAPSEREGIAAAAEAAAGSSLPARFFRYSRDEAFQVYYADARTWPALGYGGPPQPAGFADFDQPTARPSHGR